ncbi:MAG TPA: hypothetical protein VM073_04730 [Usitatibacter sp.]|nr:hypothetical protein [Usitatibacter sp.]
MNALRSLPLAVACALSPLAGAETAITVYSSARPGTLSSQTIRSGGEGGAIPGYALVKEERAFPLKAGRNVLRVTDVPALIDPTTVSFASLTDPTSTRVVEQSFEFDLTSTAKLLSRYLDREITVEQSRGNAVEAFTGTLVGTQGGITLRQADGSVRVLENRAGIRLPSLPGGLISKPTLVWDIDTRTAGSHASRFTYQTAGMTWWTDYNVTYTEGAGASACQLDVGAWVTLVNQSGASYADARLKLIAGDVQRAQPRYPAAPQALAMRAAAADKVEGFAEKAFFEYHLYTLGRATSLPDNSTKQIELFPMAGGANCEKTLVYQGQGAMPYYGSPMLDRAFGVQSNRKVDVYLRFRNAAANRLGMPLPAGKVRVSKLDPADRSLEFIGEDLIDHTARDEMVQLRLGSAFDVVGERRQVDFRIDTNAKWMEEDIEVKVRNQKPDEAANVVVKENLYRWSTWTLLRKSHEFTKEDARTIHFPLRLAPKQEATVRYTVRYTW